MAVCEECGCGMRCVGWCVILLENTPVQEVLTDPWRQVIREQFYVELEVHTAMYIWNRTATGA